MESGNVYKTLFLNLIPKKFHFAFHKDKLELLSTNMENHNQILQSALVAAKQSFLKIHIDRPLDDVILM